ncbi:M20/M25/M40 family metallo-hydrolase [Brachyspira hyodysenteriae]|nr:M20/M25/M40 family metallo-hydrolase [Brachyspira hyodysenteriae]
MAESIAAANRAKAEVVIKRRGAPVVNNEKIYEQLNEVCNELGFKKASHYSLSMAGEDFADYLEKIDGAFILFSTATEKNIAHHNSKFEIDESKLYQPPVLMSEWAIKYLENNKL